MTVNEANEAIKRNFPDQLKDCMELAAMNASKLARETKASPTMISNYLAGRFIPNAALALSIAETLGVTVELLLTGKERFDYLNHHHVYIDAHNAPDLSMEVKRDDAEKGIEIMENRINTLYGTPDETPAERIVRLYRSGMSHVDIAQRGFDLADVRRVISEATRKDETLYPMHQGMNV